MDWPCNERSFFDLRSDRQCRVAHANQGLRHESPLLVRGRAAHVDRVEADLVRVVLDQRHRRTGEGLAGGIDDVADQGLATLRRDSRADAQGGDERAEKRFHGCRCAP